MELVCIDKQTFEELRIRFCKFEERMTHICRPVEDLGLKNWLDNQEVCDVLASTKETLQAYRAKGILPFSRIKNKLFYKPEDIQRLLDLSYHPFNKEQIMSYHFIDRKDPHIDVMFQGLEKLEKMLSVLEEIPRTLFNGERFLTDEELSNVLRVSRRTLQEYRTSGVIPYYLVQGKALYKESDIMKILDDAYKRCREEQRWV